MTKQDFDALPLSVREKAKRTLRGFSEARIVYHDGEYHVYTSSMLLGKYPDDFKVVGDVHKDDIYTPDEQIINYIECFHDYPLQYKGKYDYSMLDYMHECRKNGEERKVKLVDGTARLIV